VIQHTLVRINLQPCLDETRLQLRQSLSWYLLGRIDSTIRLLALKVVSVWGPVRGSDGKRLSGTISQVLVLLLVIGSHSTKYLAGSRTQDPAQIQIAA